MDKEPKSKAQQLVDMNRERRARGFQQKKAERVSLLISKDRAIRTEPVSARKDPDLRAKQIQEKKEEEVRRLAKIAKDKQMNIDVAARKAQAEANRQNKIAADRKAEEEREFDAELAENKRLADEAEAKAQAEAREKSKFAKIPNTATPAAQKLADKHGIDISELRAGADNRIQLSEVKAAVKALSGE